MRCLLLLALLCLSAAVPAYPAPVPAGGPDSLWSMAVSLAEANTRWVPGTIYMRMQEVDKHGEPKDEGGHEVWTRLYLGEDGEVASEMIKVLDDGEDVTEEERARLAGEEAGEDDDDGDGGHMTLEGYSPFDPGHQDRIVVLATGRQEEVDGRQCFVFEFEDEREGKDREEKVLGEAWLEAETGIPLKLGYTTDPLPKRVKKMYTTVLYDYDGPDAWYAGSLSLKATGGILFIKKHFSMSLAFSDYWRMPEEADSAGADVDEAVPQ